MRKSLEFRALRQAHSSILERLSLGNPATYFIFFSSHESAALSRRTLKSDIAGGPFRATTGLMHWTKVVSLNHLVGADEQRRRDVDAELFRRLEIDYQFELGGLHHRQFRGLFALQDASDIDTCLPPRVRHVGAVAEKATGKDVRAPNADRRNPVAESHCDV